MAHNNAVIMAVLCFVIGIKLIGQAVSGVRCLTDDADDSSGG